MAAAAARHAWPRRRALSCVMALATASSPGSVRARPDPPLPQIVALAYHGHYVRNDTFRHAGHSDFFRVAESQRRMLFEPLRAAGMELRTFFHTYTHRECPGADAELVRILRPAAHEFSASALPKIVDSYMRALALVMRHTRADDARTAVMLVRFDVAYFVPLTQLPIDWAAFNTPYRDRSSGWKTWRTVSDLLFIFPLNLSTRVLGALSKSGGRYKSGAAHYVVRYLTEPGGAEGAGLWSGPYMPGGSGGIKVRVLAPSGFHSSSLAVQRLERLHNGEDVRVKDETAASVKEIFLAIERRSGAGVQCRLKAIAAIPQMPVGS